MLQSQKICKRCHKRKAMFVYRGRVGQDRHHDCCQQCWTALLNQHWQKQLPSAPRWEF